MLIAIVLSCHHRRPGMSPHAMRPDPERMSVASEQMTRIDVKRLWRIASVEAARWTASSGDAYSKRLITGGLEVRPFSLMVPNFSRPPPRDSEICVPFAKA